MKPIIEPVQTFKILILGDSGVGKSSLMTRFVHGVFNNQHNATIGVDFQIATVNIGGYKCRLQIWDTAGQERFRSITTSYYRGADGVIIVYDVTNSETFTRAKDQLNEIQQVCDRDIPKILVGNKDDSNNQMNKAVKTPDAHEYAQQNDLSFFEISVKDNKNIIDLFNNMAKLVLKQRLEQSKHMPINNPNLEMVKNQKKNCCNI